VSLRDYARKRRFSDTPEPADDAALPTRGRKARRPIFVVQLHNARARHFDFRLEADGALKSWAVPKGPSLRAGEKRLAVQVEDHPISYAGFQGQIPEGNYGAGHVLVFDHGVWSSEGDPLEAIAAGKLDFTLEGAKLRGAWKLVRTGMTAGRSGGKPQWLLIKRDDAHARDADADDLVDVEPGPESSARAGPILLSGEGERSPPARGAAADRARKQRTGARAPTASQPARKPAAPVRRSDAAWRKRALALPQARDRPFPPGFKPELATLRQHAPRGDDWLHEVKWDGYRMLADLVDGTARLRSRNGLDWTADFPALAAAVQALPVGDARLDGELVALDAAGMSDFALLQRALQGPPRTGSAGTSTPALRYVVFDLPGLAGVDLSRTPLLERKRLLEALLGRTPGDALLYSQHVRGHGEEVFAASGVQGLEGIISKRVDAPYTQSRSAHWIKTKHAQGDEFVVVGYTPPQGARSGFGALLMATRDADGTLRYVGRVGTGYTADALRALHAKLQPLRRKTATVALPGHLPYDKRDRGNIHWVKPQVVAEVAYRGWGKDGLLRQASFQRLRVDKTVEDIGMAGTTQASTARARTAAAAVPAASRAPATTASEPAAKGPPRKRAAASSRRAGRDAVAISSRERIVFAADGITKGEVADYYAAVADWIMPDLARRPLSLLRCPDGAGGTCFFQKHHAGSLGEHVHAVSLRQKSGPEDYLFVRDAAGLLELVQMNTLEFHPWGAHVDKPERPDTLVFDLDPGPGVSWKQVVAGARDVRARLQEAGLQSFVRLSGGKGVHVVVPIRRGPSWEQAKDFASAFAEAMAAHRPLQYVATMSKAKRHDRIFIDWLRNGRGATSVCSWSLRARDGAPVAMPIRWEELGRVGGPDAFDLRKALKRAKTLKADPWDGYAQTRQSLPKLD
jgi:bifunctional non-homologous end joining protein LigD